MAVTHRKAHVERDYKKMAEEILRQGEDEALQARRLEELRQRVAYYEAKYGLPSDEVHQAIEDRRLRETFEVSCWIMDYNSLRHVLATKR